ncbi:MAG: bis(5'-nucleosyl)-tetraphosphatase (symmetrical) YqeK [Firmicutes bacterium]|nr:bis(5'-nucleosyl)-tetraphosphatase (symmetrical) YqeK [Bacillota bacterium]
MTDEKIKDIIKSRLSEKRYQHSLAVADEAKILADRYGCDPDKAYTAGLLHDIMKCAPVDEQLAAVDRSGVAMTELEISAPKLYHAMAGAAYIEHELGITDREIIDAVRYHTTARAGMSTLEKVIYLADFTSADRDYDGVDEMRAAVRRTLHEAMMIALKFSISDLLGCERAVHPDTLAAYNAETFCKK